MTLVRRFCFNKLSGLLILRNTLFANLPLFPHFQLLFVKTFSLSKGSFVPKFRHGFHRQAAGF